MSESDNDRDQSEDDEEQLQSEVSSGSQENQNHEPDFKKELIIHKELNDMKCATYVFNNQDHTLGNMLRVVLNGNADVQFAGYSIPHPSEAKMNLRIQAKTRDTNQILNESLNTIQNISKTLREKFMNSLSNKK